MTPDTLQPFLCLAIGFAFAGAIANGYQLVADRPLSFGLLEEGASLLALVMVPVLAFAAPFVILRNTIRGRRIERRRFAFVVVATVIAGYWSLLSGSVFVMVLRAAGILAA
jgi:hypothetical protein